MKQIKTISTELLSSCRNQIRLLVTHRCLLMLHAHWFEGSDMLSLRWDFFEVLEQLEPDTCEIPTGANRQPYVNGAGHHYTCATLTYSAMHESLHAAKCKWVWRSFKTTSEKCFCCFAFVEYKLLRNNILHSVRKLERAECNRTEKLITVIKVG